MLMQLNKESSSKLHKKPLRKVSTYKKKQQKHTLNAINSSRIKSPLSQKSLKRNSQSPSRCSLCGSFPMNDLLKRFKQLQGKYIETLEMIKQKNQVYQMQRNQIQRLRVDHQRDKKSIHQLRGLLGFLHKSDSSTQTYLFQNINQDKKNLHQKYLEIEELRSSRRIIETPKKTRNPKLQGQSYAFYSHNYSNQSTKTLPQRKRMSQKKVIQNRKQDNNQDHNSKIKKYGKNIQQQFMRNPQAAISKFHHKSPVSSYSKLRYKFKTDIDKY